VTIGGAGPLTARPDRGVLRLRGAPIHDVDHRVGAGTTPLY
jgi:hypothetical protein